MAKLVRTAYLIIAWLFVIGVLIQMFLAGLFLFAQRSYHPIHGEFGRTYLGFPLLALLALGVLGRYPRRMLGLTGLLFVLFALLSIFLFFRRSDTPEIAALHPVSALFVFWIALSLARRARDFVPPPLGTGRSL